MALLMVPILWLRQLRLREVRQPPCQEGEEAKTISDVCSSAAFLTGTGTVSLDYLIPESCKLGSLNKKMMMLNNSLRVNFTSKNRYFIPNNFLNHTAVSS